jgi:1-acyl-sn-glycerol-3-phosphate acyltransferase
MGVVFVRRGDAFSGARALVRVRAALEAGVHVLNFPEGTTSKSDAPRAFRRGSFTAAKLAGAPIVPVRIDYDDDDLAWVDDESFVPHYVRVIRRRSIVARVRIGRAMRARRGEDSARLADRARAAIRDLRF